MMTPYKFLGSLTIVSLLALTACGDTDTSSRTEDSTTQASVASVDAERIIQADNEPQNWLSHGRDYGEQRFSPLQQITSDNVPQLGLAWYYDLDTDRGQEATPLVVDGVMYTTTAWSKVIALDAQTGEKLWQYDPEVPGEWAVKACCDVVNRGAAVWQGKVFVGTLDGRLVALDAATGGVVWETLTIDRSQNYTITGAPRVVKGKVLIGNGGAEFGVRGYVSAYDADTGELAWRFYTVPGDPSKPFESPVLEEAAKTWSGEWWKLGGGGTVWDSMAYDPELDLLYIGTGNGSPWDPRLRSPGGGDNLFLSSIVALRPDTGEYVWHYQETPGEAWDYTATQHMVLADIELNGEVRKVLMQAPKNGFFYVLDRETGELLSAEPFIPLNWASHVDMESGRPVENPEARYQVGGKPWLALPGSLGAHNWHPMSYNPSTGLMYIPAQQITQLYVPEEDFTPSRLAVNLGLDLAAGSMPQEEDVKQQVLSQMKGFLLAWDPVAQKEVWRAQYAGPWNGGTLSTAGNLVVQGTDSGSLNVFRADTGEKLWSYYAGTGIVAAPVTYAVNGEQYIAVQIGRGGVFPLLTGEVAHLSGKLPNISRVLAFKLGGTETAPIPEPLPLPDVQITYNGTEPVRSQGKAVYHRYCSGCHGDAAVGGGVLPDLRYSATIESAASFDAFVLEGVASSHGMVSFSAELTPEDTEAIRQYLRYRASKMAGPAAN